METVQVDVCISGGGPAGLMLGLLLARQGVKVLVLEQHPDFGREFRGEVLMPRFIQLLHQLNLTHLLSDNPHTKITAFKLMGPTGCLVEMPFSRISPQIPFAVWMPQPVLLEALHQQARGYPGFSLWFGAGVGELVVDGGKVAGVVVRRGDQTVTVYAQVTVGADGRNSRVRREGPFELDWDDYSFDVVWFSVPRPAGYPLTVMGYFLERHMYVVAPKYPDLLQCGVIMAPGELSVYREQGIQAMQDLLSLGPPVVQDFARELTDYKPFFPLQARISLVRQWAADGVLLVGDAAHTFSPIGAIGVSMAVIGAAISADVILHCLKTGDTSAQALGEVQRRYAPEVESLLRLQRRLSLGFTLKWLPMRRLFARFITFAADTGLLVKTMRKLIVGHPPFPVDPALSFDAHD